MGSPEISQAVQFDARGRVVRSSPPSDQAGGAYFTELQDFDALGRPGKKVVSKAGYTNRQGQADETFVTEYFYDGLSTRIVLDGLLSAHRTYNTLDQLISTVDSGGNLTRYRYDGRGQLILIKDSGGNETRIEFDNLSHRRSIQDPDRSDWSFTPNGLGELLSQTDGNGDTVTFDYDDLGRKIERQLNGVRDASWIYDQTAYGTLDGETKFDPQSGQIVFTRTFGFDGLFRETSRTLAFNGKSYRIQTSYYGCTNGGPRGAVKGIEYPTGDAVQFDYSAYGYLLREKDPLAATGAYHRQIRDLSPRGDIEEEIFANGLTGKYEYFASTGQVRRICLGTGPTCTNPKQELEYGYQDPYGNLTHQKRYIRGVPSGTTLTSVREDFYYDSLHRLIHGERSWTGTGAPPLARIKYGYDSLGNITKKEDYATLYEYGAAGRQGPENAGPHAVRKINKVGQGQVTDFLYDDNGNLIRGDGRTLTYTFFNKPETIIEGSSSTTFFYDPNHARYRQESGGKITHYVDALFEDIDTATIDEQKLYLGSRLLISKRTVSGVPTSQLLFLHPDRLGSVETITDASGNIVEAHGYDAFGAPRKSTWVDSARKLHSNEFTSQVTTHGFTTHEHLDQHRLIHMNGRAYDPGLGRFLSVDPFVADIANGQSLNPYSYILNNPLSGIDPSGYLPLPDQGWQISFFGKGRGWGGGPFLCQLCDGKTSNGVKTPSGDGSSTGIIFGGPREEIHALGAIDAKESALGVASFGGGFLEGAFGLPSDPIKGHELSFGLGELAGGLTGLIGDAALGAGSLTLGVSGGVLCASGGGCVAGAPAAAAGAAGLSAAVGFATQLHLPNVREGSSYILKEGDDASAGGRPSDLPSPTDRRVRLRKEVRAKIEAAQPRNSAGELIDPNTKRPLEPGKIDVGHKPGQEWRKRREMHKEAGSTRAEVRDVENDPNLYHLEDRSNNRSHKYEEK